jgi:membrane protease YdiL (CAAX protease family)
LLLAALVALRREGYPLTWPALRERFRLHPMDVRTWLWTLGVWLVVEAVVLGVVIPISRHLVAQGLMPLPANLPAFLHPASPLPPRDAAEQAVGGLRGNWLPVLALAIALVFNILGEELWWRGVVLPRQELAFGRGAWVIHGLLWALFHIFKWWDVLNLVPITLGIAYVCSRFRNTTPGIVIHALINGRALIPLTLAALGVLE